MGQPRARVPGVKGGPQGLMQWGVCGAETTYSMGAAGMQLCACRIGGVCFQGNLHVTHCECPASLMVKQEQWQGRLGGAALIHALCLCVLRAYAAIPHSDSV